MSQETRNFRHQLLTEIQPWHKTFLANVRYFFQSRKTPPLPQRVPGTALYKEPRLGLEVRPWHESFLKTARGIFRSEQLPPLPANARKIQIADIWDWKTYLGQLKRTQFGSLMAHAIVILLIAVPFAGEALEPELDEPIELVSSEIISPYEPLTLPVARKKLGGGGGGGERNPLPPSKGRLPRLSLQAPLTPPAAVIRNRMPKLAAEPTVLVPPNVDLPSPDMSNYGDPLSASLIPSGGPGSGGGIGTGAGGGVGSGLGPGVGPGIGGGTGGGYFQVGGDVSEPVCIYCPDPEYSEEARKAKYQGTVILWAVIDENGRAHNIRVVKSLGLGLDEEAVRAVQNWRFRPSEKRGQPVPVQMNIEVNFRLY